MDFGKFEIIWIESCAYPRGTVVEKHEHTFFHFIYVDDGIGEITIEGKDYAMTEGNIYMLPPGIEHMFLNKNNALLKSLEIKFQINDKETETLINELPLIMNAKEYYVKSQLLSIYKESIASEYLSDEVISHKFQLMLTYLFRCYRDYINESAGGDGLKNCPSEIDKTIRYINENYGEKISLEELADVAGFEKNYFLRKFKKTKKCTPMAFLRKIRIEKAKELLCFSDMSVSQIAYMTGFETVHHFSNVFLKNTGTRPREYREANKL